MSPSAYSLVGRGSGSSNGNSKNSLLVSGGVFVVYLFIFFCSVFFCDHQSSRAREEQWVCINSMRVFNNNQIKWGKNVYLTATHMENTDNEAVAKFLSAFINECWLEAARNFWDNVLTETTNIEQPVAFIIELWIFSLVNQLRSSYCTYISF